MKGVINMYILEWFPYLIFPSGTQAFRFQLPETSPQIHKSVDDGSVSQLVLVYLVTFVFCRT